MNFLKICQRLAVETGVNIPMSTVLGQTGELARIVNWVGDAWTEIQGDKLWNWMWEQPTLSLPASASSIATTISEHRWLKHGTYLPLVSSDSGDRFLDYLPWVEFCQVYPRITQQAGLTAWSIAPDNSMRFNAIVTPAAATDVVVQRYALPTTLTGDADTPGMPTDLHMLIVYEAMVRYADFDEAGSQRTSTVAKLNRMQQNLNDRCLPEFTLGAGLVSNAYYNL